VTGVNQSIPVERMKKLHMTQLLLAVALVCPSITFSETQISIKDVKPSGLTLEQVIEYLDLEGDNILFEFDEPVFMNIRISSKSPDDEKETVRNDWISEASRKIKVSLLVEKVERTKHNPNDYLLVYKISKMIYDEPEIEEMNNTTITLTSYGGSTFYGRHVIQTGSGEMRANKLHLVIINNKIQSGKPILLRGYLDSDSPENSFHKIEIIFSTTPPT